MSNTKESLMAEQMRPASPKQAPDPSNSYGREHPENEAGMGRMDNDKAVPPEDPDRMHQAVKNKQPNRQLNASDPINQRGGSTAESRERREHSKPASAKADSSKPDHSMADEEPLGWDQAPQGIQNPRDKRQPKIGGKGGTP
jgi:hypothetical protein